MELIANPWHDRHSKPISILHTKLYSLSLESIRNESRGHWYMRQLRGSSNIGGGRVMDLLSGNLSHQIEHHFYPDIPAHRYATLAVEVREICARYGQPYNTGSLPRQFGEVVWRILRHAFPSRPKRVRNAPEGVLQQA